MSRVIDDARPVNPMAVREELVEHLRFLKEIGVHELRLAAPRPGIDSEMPAMGTSGQIPPEAEPAVMAPVNSAAADELEQFRLEGVGDCRECRLCESRTNIVFGVGNPDARLMFVGEGPGRTN